MKHFLANFEFLQSIFPFRFQGEETMQRFDLNIRASGYSHDYDENINACVTSEFSTAAFRFGHSVVDGKLM